VKAVRDRGGRRRAGGGGSPVSDPDYLDRLVDDDALGAYLTAEFGSADTFAVERHAEGHSNETLFVTWGDRELVVRRPPPARRPTRPTTCSGEYRVVDALGDTDVPVPRTLRACDDHGVLGSDFYLMERAEGDVLRETEPERFANPAAREGSGPGSSTRWRRSTGGRLRGGRARRLRPPCGVYGPTGRALDRAARVGVETTTEVREVPDLIAVGEWLADNAPDEHPETLVHGDFKLDNVMYGPGTPPAVVAVFDWGLSTTRRRPARRSRLAAPVLVRRGRSGPGDARADVDVHRAGGVPDPRGADRSVRDDDGTRVRPRAVLPRARGLQDGRAGGEMFLARHLNDDSDDPLYPMEMEAQVPTLAARTLAYVEGETERL